MKENESQNDQNDIFASNTYTQYEIEAQTICVSIEEGETKNKNNNVSTLSREEKIKSLKQHTNESLKLTDKRRSSQSFLKSLVSQDKNRFCFDGYDLDLTYITPRIIAMGLPSTSLEALYRNNLTDVLNFFNERHPEHYKVYNLCEEKNYAPNIFYKQGYFPFQDHEAPPLNLIRP